jgi:hypothetical protein
MREHSINIRPDSRNAYSTVTTRIFMVDGDRRGSGGWDLEAIRIFKTTL